MVIDNFPAAVAGADRHNPRLTGAFLGYAQHRGFIPDPTRSYYPQDKSQVAYCTSFATSAISGSLTGLITLRGPLDRAGGFSGQG